MITQEQYERLCGFFAHGTTTLNGQIATDIADLLESYERLHIELEALAATGASCVGVTAFDALFDDEGQQRVNLMVRGKPAPKVHALSSFPTRSHNWRTY